jgi:hypothetical protein
MPLMPPRLSRPFHLRVAGIFLVLVLFAAEGQARKKDPVFATSANDPVLRASIAALAPSVDPEEAARVAAIAYTIGRDLKKEWKVVWPPGVHNFLVNTKQRKGGLCFQFAERLLLRLAQEKWETLEFHWAESFERTASEHNVILVTAKGQHFSHGIILDNWRYGGRLVWGLAIDDPHYQWQENKSQYLKVLARRAEPVSSPAPSPAAAAAANAPTSSETAR